VENESTTADRLDVPDGGDPAVRPQDDLFGHVNGAWYDTVEIPPDLPMTGAGVNLLLEAEAQVGEILRECVEEARSGRAATGSPRQQIGDLYTSFLDTERLEELGLAPLESDLADIAAVADVSALARLDGAFERVGAGSLLGLRVDTDDRNSDRYVVNITQAGIGLPDESYYRDDSFASTRESYAAHIAAIFRLLGRSADDAAAAAERILALETRLAGGHWDSVASRDVVKTYNLMTDEQLREAAPSLDFDAYLEGLQAPTGAFDEAVVRQPSYLETLSTALTEVPLDDWREWMTFHVVSAHATYLSKAFDEQHFDFYRRTLTGAQEQRERWKRAVALSDQLLGEAVGEAYVARHFPPEAKAQMDALVANLVEAYRRDIERLDWMGPQTRAKALEKLRLFRPKIGYPPKWRDYSSIEIDAGDLFGNVRRARAFETDRQLAKIGRPVDRDEWLMTPQTVNAYYNPGTNEICFPAAILRPPFFDPDADPALNYGGIGAVIGHEIGHGFDDQGSQYDGEGNLVDWWTDADRERFSERADRLIGQYNEFEPRNLPGKKINGALTVGENIGDLGGLTVGLQAYLISRADSDGSAAAAPTDDDLGAGLRRLFVNWGLVWRTKVRPELATQLLAVDPHSPAELRANVARNLDEFHEVFETQPGDGLWLDPADRVHIW
jgi:endothelin-converting enzyme/putative endopeptidase